jgi:hypothetical protein
VSSPSCPTHVGHSHHPGQGEIRQFRMSTQLIPQREKVQVPPQPASSHLPKLPPCRSPCLRHPLLRHRSLPRCQATLTNLSSSNRKQPPQQQQVSPTSFGNQQQTPHQSLQYAQHGLPTHLSHLDPAQAQHQSPLPQQQVPSSFYRQPGAQGHGL